MNKNETVKDHLLSIGQASDMLGVSIDTLRRWEKAGKIRSVRPDGKNRFFSILDLEKFQLSKLLSITEAAERLNMSSATLRRIEERGIVHPSRDKNGARMYCEDDLQNILNSEHFLRQKDAISSAFTPSEEPK